MLLRNIILLTFLNFLYSNSIAQPKEQQIITEVEQAAEDFRDRILQEPIDPDFNQELIIEFRVDTFKIGKYLRSRNQHSTKFIHKGYALFKAVQAYGELVGKYYNLLLQELNDYDKKILKNSQSNWLEYKQNEIRLNENLGSKEYGNVLIEQEPYINKRILELNRNRAEELFTYLIRVKKGA